MELNKTTTRVGNFQTVAVSRKIDLDPKSTDIAIVNHVGSDKRVLELGCASGHMSQVLRSKGCTVVGIEINPEAAQRATTTCERVIVADLDYMNFEKELGSDRFDVVVAADVLEHLKDPGSVLQALKTFLLPGGCLVSSIPNIAHLSVRLALLSGNFSYGDGGLLDRTHLRFFTRESAEKLLENAGFAIGHLERIENLPADPSLFEVPYDPKAIPPALQESLAQDPEALTYQFVMVSYPIPHPALDLLQQRMKDMAWQAANARKENLSLRTQLDQSREQDHSRQDLLERSAGLVNDLEARNQLLSARADSGECRILELQHELEIRSEAISSLEQQVMGSSQLNCEAERRIASLREQDGLKEQKLGELSQSHELLCRNAAESAAVLAEQKQRIAELTAKVAIQLSREKDLREMLLDAHDQLMRRDEEIASALATTLPRNLAVETTPAASQVAFAPQTLPGKYLVYQQLLQKVRAVVRTAVPAGANVLVISKGDDELLKLEPCNGWHFPQTEDGRYAGYHPADSLTAVRHLEELRERGAQFLLIPQTSLWWLDHYQDFGKYLDQHCQRIIDQPDVCVAFALAAPRPREASTELPREVSPAENVRPFGVNISGHLTSEKGVGEAVRSQIRSLRAVGIPLELNDFPDDTALNLEREFTEFSNDNPYSVNLIHLNADSLEFFAEWKTRRYFADHYNIGYWAWETPAFPRRWWDRFQFLNEIWVGSDFVLDAVSRVSPIPVVKVLLAIPDRLSLRRLPRSHFGLSQDSFVFLFIFDFMSVFQRKNPLALIEAFRSAFTKRDNAVLVLKCSHSERHPAELEALQAACKGMNVRIINEVLSREETTSLMTAADCYVSLHRSEGFGLTIAEAMSLAKPVIATAFSGNMDFMSPANSYPVKYKLVRIGESCGPYEEGMWADPDVSHAAQLMRHAFKNPKAAMETGRQGRTDIMQLLNEQRLGNLMRDRLLRIADFERIGRPASDTIEVPVAPIHTKHSLYENLVRRIRNVVEETIQRRARVIVVSKGDDDILRFRGPQGWHFPQTSDGVYAGHHPADGADAISHLEQLKVKGGQFFLLPQTAFWWLDHYTEFRSHLEARYRKVWSDPDCIIYKLSQKNGRIPRASVEPRSRLKT